MEERGKGVNRVDFLVTNNVFNPWVRLPLISSKDIRESRRMKYIFTGNLNHEIDSSP